MKPAWLDDARLIPDEVMSYLRMIAVHAVRGNGFSPEDVSEMLGISRSSVYAWLKRFKSDGYEGLETKKAPGAEPIVTEAMDTWLKQTVLEAPFAYRPTVDLSGLRVGYLEDAFAEDYPGRELDLAVLDVLRSLGADPVPISLPTEHVEALSFILSAEAAAAFDELTRSGRDQEMVRQIRYAWPNVFRAARLIPAVEYLQANRVRWQIIQAMADVMRQVDVYVAPSFGGDNLLLTNLTGHPCVVLPDGFLEPDRPKSITFMGRLYDEATLLAVARAYQEATDFHRAHPPAFAP